MGKTLSSLFTRICPLLVDDVQHYFSDFLSIIETREKKGLAITTSPFLTTADVGVNTLDKSALVGLTIPENVYIIGTVNMDETTHPFSKKVLDRANTIEINEVDLDFSFVSGQPIQIPTNGIDFLRSDYVTAVHLSTEDLTKLTEKVLPRIKQINELLKEADLQFGYRVRDVIFFYMTYAQTISDILSFEQAFDYQIMQKILPRIQGSSVRIQELLISLGNVLLSNRADKPLAANDTYGQRSSKIKDASTLYPRSLAKINFMLRRYQQDGFTSFWL